MVKHPFIVIADFESFIIPKSGCKPNDSKSYSVKYQEHKPCGFCYYIISDVKDFEPVLYRAKSDDEDVSEVFCKMLVKDLRKIYKIFYR